MAVSLVVSEQFAAGASSATAETPSFTVSGTDRVMWIHIHTQDLGPSTPTDVKFPGSSGASATRIGSVITNGFLRTTLWRLVAPATGSGTVHVTWPGGQQDRTVLVDQWSGVDQATPNGTIGENSSGGASPPSSINVSTVAGDVVRDSISISSDVAISPGADQTTIESVSGVTGFDAAISTYETATGGTTTMSEGGWGTVGLGHYAFVINAAAAGTGFELVAEQPIALQGVLGIAAALDFEANISIVALGPIALQGVLGIQADLVFEIKRWRVPSNAPEGTAVHMIVFSGAGPTYAILAQGDTTVDADGHAHIPAVGTIGTKAFAFVHNYDDDPDTLSIYGGPCIATIEDVG